MRRRSWLIATAAAVFVLQAPLCALACLSNREKAAMRGAEASGLLVEDRRLTTDGAVESAWAELGFAQQALDITNRNIDLLRQLAATAESRYRVGTGLQQDILRAQVELTALLQERLRRDEAIERAESELVTLLDLPAETELPRTAALVSSQDVPSLPPFSRRSRIETHTFAQHRKGSKKPGYVFA